MRLIPGRTKVKIELFRGITIGDVIVGTITLGLSALVVLSTFPGRMTIAGVIASIGSVMLIRIDSEPNYEQVLGIVRFLAYPRRYRSVSEMTSLPALLPRL